MDRVSPSPPARRGLQTLFWCAVALVTGLAVYVLPFASPPPIPTFSTSYTYGFNNRVAELSAVGLSAAVLVALWLWRKGRIPSPDSPADRMPTSWLVIASSTAILFTAVLGGFMVHANTYYSDATYFLTQIARVLHDHAVLYRDVEFAYGPLLFYWPAAMQQALGLIGIPAAAASMVTLASMQVIGLCMLFYILHWLPLSRPLRALALGLFTFGTLTPLLGMNYTLVRFLLPHTLFLAILRVRSLITQSILFAIAQLIALGFSPEIGIAFLGGVGCYALYRSFTTHWSWIAAGLPPLAASALFATLMSKDYFRVIGHYVIGGFNLVVMPDLHIQVLLISAIALSPIAVAGYLQTRDPLAASMLGFYIISLGMFVPALGRCDPLHTFFAGAGIYLLSLAAVNRLTSVPALVWMAALSIMVIGYQVDDFRVYKTLMAAVVFPDPPEWDMGEIDHLESLTHGQRIAAPIVTPLWGVQELTRRGEFQPSYFVFMVGVWDDASEQRKVDELRQAPFALIADWDYETAHPDFETSRISRAFRLGYRYHPRFAPWIQGAAIARELRAHWTAVGSVGDYIVYHQNGR